MIDFKVTFLDHIKEKERLTEKALKDISQWSDAELFNDVLGFISIL